MLKCVNYKYLNWDPTGLKTNQAGAARGSPLLIWSSLEDPANLFNKLLICLTKSQELLANLFNKLEPPPANLFNKLELPANLFNKLATPCSCKVGSCKGPPLLTSWPAWNKLYRFPVPFCFLSVSQPVHLTTRPFHMQPGFHNLFQGGIVLPWEKFCPQTQRCHFPISTE